MIQAAKIIGTGLATTGLIGAGVGIGVVFGALILGVATSVSLIGQLFSYAILGFAFAEATGLFVLITWSSLLYLYRSQVPNLFILIVLVFINSIRFVIKSPLWEWCHISNMMPIFYIWCGVIAVTTLWCCNYILGKDSSGSSLIITFLIATLFQVFTNYISEVLYFCVLLSWAPQLAPEFIVWLKYYLVPSFTFNLYDVTRMELLAARNWYQDTFRRLGYIPPAKPLSVNWVISGIRCDLWDEHFARGGNHLNFVYTDPIIYSRICEILAAGYPRM